MKFDLRRINFSNILFVSIGVLLVLAGFFLNFDPDRHNEFQVACETQDSFIREAPKVIDNVEYQEIKWLADLSFMDIHNKNYQFRDFSERNGVVFALTGTSCPLSLKYAPTLAAIERSFKDKGISFVYINPFKSEDIDNIKESVEFNNFKGAYIHDTEKSLISMLSAKTSTEVFVFDQSRKLTYRGAVDDQYGFGYTLDEPRSKYLINALIALLSGRIPDIKATTAPGCKLSLKEISNLSEDNTISYHNRISRIIQSNCLECHRDGGLAPIKLDSYDDVSEYSEMIKEVVLKRIMPPWFAAPLSKDIEIPDGSIHWSNDRSLSAREIKDLVHWIDNGMPEGNAKDAPEPVIFPDGWLIGNPDAVFEFAEPVSVRASGSMPYKNIIVETQLKEDRWVQAIEIRPEAIGVVHHVVVFLVDEQKNQLSEVRGYWGIYVPGNSTLIYPEGYAKLLPKGAKLRFQMHYQPNGKETTDKTRIGIVFAKNPPKHQVKVMAIANLDIVIPPGRENHLEFKDFKVPYEIKILGYLPHMHLRGKAARFEGFTKNGKQTLLDIPNYDFNWQLNYRLSNPQTFMPGDIIRFSCWFDNSPQNPANPNPSATVKWGLQTEDEMHLGYIDYIVPNNDLQR